MESFLSQKKKYAFYAIDQIRTLETKSKYSKEGESWLKKYVCTVLEIHICLCSLVCILFNERICGGIKHSFDHSIE